MAYLGPSLRRVKRSERPLRRAAVAVIASVALNALLLRALIAAGAFHLAGPADRTRVALSPLSSSQWDANRAIARAPGGTADQPKAAAPPPQDRLDGRVVELNPDQKASEKPPPNAKYLSDRNTRVDRETVSRYAGNYARVAPKPEAGAEGK